MKRFPILSTAVLVTLAATVVARGLALLKIARLLQVRVAEVLPRDPAGPARDAVASALNRVAGLNARSAFRVRPSAWARADGGSAVAGAVWIVGDFDYRTRQELAWTAGAEAEVVVVGIDGTQLMKRTVTLPAAAASFAVQIPDDGALAPGDYAVFRPFFFVCRPACGDSTPCGTPSDWRIFRPAPPPPLFSDVYARSVNEVKDFGRLESKQRSEDQNEVAAWGVEMNEIQRGRTRRQIVETELALLAVITMTLGNLLALVQRNIKRMMAYSSIGHMGYPLLGLAAARVGGAAPRRRRTPAPGCRSVGGGAAGRPRRGERPPGHARRHPPGRGTPRGPPRGSAPAGRRRRRAVRGHAAPGRPSRGHHVAMMPRILPRRSRRRTRR